MDMKEEKKPLLVPYEITMIILEIQSSIGIIKELGEKGASFRPGKANPYSSTLWTKLIVLELTENVQRCGLWSCQGQSMLWTKTESLEGTDLCQLSNFVVHLKIEHRILFTDVLNSNIAGFWCKCKFLGCQICFGTLIALCYWSFMSDFVLQGIKTFFLSLEEAQRKLHW